MNVGSSNDGWNVVLANRNSIEQSPVGANTLSLSYWRQVWVPATCLAGCLALFVWACGRGFDFADDAFYLTWAADAFTYKTSHSDFAYIWHPIYRLSDGNITLYRLLGMIVLTMCGLTFGTALACFVREGVGRRTSRGIIVIAATTAIFWEFMEWEPSPNYNELNLCTLLLFFAGLLLIKNRYADSSGSDVVTSGALAPPVIVGASFAIMMLNKPTTCAVAFPLAVLWIGCFRPRRPILVLATAAVSGIMVSSVAILNIDGSFGAFLHRKISAISLWTEYAPSSDIHGMFGSIVGPFLPERRWKVWPATEFGGVIFSICLASLAIERVSYGITRYYKRALLALTSILLGAVVMLWRAKDFAGPAVLPAYHAWHFILLLQFLAVITFVVGLGSINLRDVPTAQRIAAAAILALAPFAYSFGSNNPVIIHMNAASAFWVGSSVLLATLLPRDFVSAALKVIGTNVGTATIGCFLGVMASPNLLIVHPMWEQSVPTRLGPQNSALLIDAATAGFIADVRTAAYLNGYMQGMPIIDLSGAGPGLIFALKGRAPQTPWLPANSADGDAFARAVLRTISPIELMHSWILTASESSLQGDRAKLLPVGLQFPLAYERVVTAKRSDTGWSEILWKPRRSAVTRSSNAP